MNTLILRNRPRKSGDNVNYSIEIIGDSAIKDDIRESIRALEYHPAKASRRNIIDMMALIEKHKLNIRYTEHYFEEEIEHWMFVLQG